MTARSVRVRAVRVPLATPHQTAGGTVSEAPLVLVDLETEEGVTGVSYVFCYTPLALQPVAQLVANLEAVIEGKPATPRAIEDALQARFRLLGPQGLTGIAMAALDMAAWDALAKAAGLPLARLLGAEPRPIPVYHSLGMGGGDWQRGGGSVGGRGVPGGEIQDRLSGRGDGRRGRPRSQKGRGRATGRLGRLQPVARVPEAVRRGRILDGEGDRLDRGADHGRRFRRSRPDCAGTRHADPAGRKLVGHLTTWRRA